MGKIKTRKTLKKRLKMTRRGKLLKKSTHSGHLKVKVGANTKHRKKGFREQANSGHIKMFKKMLGK